MAVPASGVLQLKKVNNERLNCVYSNTYSPTAFTAPATLKSLYYAGTTYGNGNSLPALNENSPGYDEINSIATSTCANYSMFLWYGYDQDAEACVTTYCISLKGQSILTDFEAGLYNESAFFMTCLQNSSGQTKCNATGTQTLGSTGYAGSVYTTVPTAFNGTNCFSKATVRTCYTGTTVDSSDFDTGCFTEGLPTGPFPTAMGTATIGNASRSGGFNAFSSGIINTQYGAPPGSALCYFHFQFRGTGA
tara:strand:+ start:374 stop:1120 length:747 start_codon:yes stop_codon:yes gene_type:complete